MLHIDTILTHSSRRCLSLVSLGILDRRYQRTTTIPPFGWFESFAFPFADRISESHRLAFSGVISMHLDRLHSPFDLNKHSSMGLQETSIMSCDAVH
jgi:hypothetical protein